MGFAPLEEGKVLDINVTSPLGRSLRLDHKNGSSIIDEKVRRAVKGKAQVMKDGAHVEELFPGVGSANEFSFRAGECHSALILRFVDNRSTRHEYNHTTNGAAMGEV